VRRWIEDALSLPIVARSATATGVIPSLPFGSRKFTATGGIMICLQILAHGLQLQVLVQRVTQEDEIRLDLLFEVG